jgi:hypothetical protein
MGTVEGAERSPAGAAAAVKSSISLQHRYMQALSAPIVAGLFCGLARSLFDTSVRAWHRRLVCAQYGGREGGGRRAGLRRGH